MKNLKLMLMAVMSFSMAVFAQDVEQVVQNGIVNKDGIVTIFGKPVFDYNTQEAKLAIVKALFPADVQNIDDQGFKLDKNQKIEAKLALYDQISPKAAVTLEQSMIGSALFVASVVSYLTYLHFYGSEKADVEIDKN